MCISITIHQHNAWMNETLTIFAFTPRRLYNVHEPLQWVQLWLDRRTVRRIKDWLFNFDPHIGSPYSKHRCNQQYHHRSYRTGTSFDSSYFSTGVTKAASLRTLILLHCDG